VLKLKISLCWISIFTLGACVPTASYEVDFFDRKFPIVVEKMMFLQ